MATNPPNGDGRRYGAVRDRSQTFNPKKIPVGLSVVQMESLWTRKLTANHLKELGEKTDMKYLIYRTAISRKIDFRKELGF